MRSDVFDYLMKDREAELHARVVLCEQEAGNHMCASQPENMFSVNK